MSELPVCQYVSALDDAKHFFGGKTISDKMQNIESLVLGSHLEDVISFFNCGQSITQLAESSSPRLPPRGRRSRIILTSYDSTMAFRTSNTLRIALLACQHVHTQ